MDNDNKSRYVSGPQSKLGNTMEGLVNDLCEKGCRAAIFATVTEDGRAVITIAGEKEVAIGLYACIGDSLAKAVDG